VPPQTRVSGTKLTEEAEFDPSDTTDKPAFTSRHIRLPFHHSTADATTSDNTSGKHCEGVSTAWSRNPAK
jgi:hypothetical protein